MAKGPFTIVDRNIDRVYVKTGKGFLKATKPALKIDKNIDRTYSVIGMKFMNAAVPIADFDKMIDHTYVETGEKFIKSAGPVADFDKMIDHTYVETGEKFIKSVGVHGKRRYRYLMDPVSIFDQSAEDFYTEVAIDIIGALKYPYAFATNFIDFIMDRKNSRDVDRRAEEFEKRMKKLIGETPNISGISMSILIILGMLAIYLLTTLKA
jgi:hypothetical protein